MKTKKKRREKEIVVRKKLYKTKAKIYWRLNFNLSTHKKIIYKKLLVHIEKKLNFTLLFVNIYKIPKNAIYSTFNSVFA